MNYTVFRSAVLEVLEEDREWNLQTDWEELPEGDSAGGNGSPGENAGLPEDFIELERERGAIYEFMTISVNKLFLFYLEEGWDAVYRDLEKYVRREKRASGRTRGIDYAARLNERGAELYSRLRGLRSDLAVKKQLPPYFIFTNRALYEMCCSQPDTMEALLDIYGVGEKNSHEYGELFLAEIREFTGGRKQPMKKRPEGEPLL